MQHEDLFALFWKLAAAVLMTFIISVTVYNIETNKIIAQMVADGAPPLEAKCSISSSSQMCYVVASKSGGGDTIINR